jgi:uncharacterized protein (DUF2147 family)
MGRIRQGLAVLGATAALSCAAIGSAWAQQELPVVPLDPIEGTWRTVSLSEVTITVCPDGFCGVLSNIVVPEGLLSGAEAEAAAALGPENFFDERNQDPALRNRPMLGLQILTLVPSDKPNIYDGTIYNPEDGNTYSGYMELITPDLVRLNGCVLFNVVCRGEDWVRVIVPEEGEEATP